MKEKMNKKYFFDTYALIEIYKGNPNYEKYRDGINLILNKLNLMEYSYFLMRVGRKNEIENFFLNLSRFCVDYDDEILKSAVEMKFKYKKDKLSFVDCIGYFLAKKHGCKFLTGDEKFKDLKNVEFVK